jgi:hypothetical protein
MHIPSVNWMIEYGWIDLPGIILFILDILLLFITSAILLQVIKTELQRYKIYTVSLLSLFVILITSSAILTGHTGFFSLAGFLTVHSMCFASALLINRLVIGKAVSDQIVESLKDLASIITGPFERVSQSNHKFTLGSLYALIATILIYYLFMAAVTIPRI